MSSSTDDVGTRGIPVDVCNILSPCVYWVRNIPVTNQDKELFSWTENFNSQCNKLHRSHIKHQLDLKEDDLVAVLSNDTKRWDRGQIKSYYQTTSKFICKIFLIDRGQEVDVESNNVISLSENFSLKPRLAYQIGVFGIFPKFEDDDHRCQKECKCKQSEYVRYLLNNYAIQFDCIVNIGGIEFGHVYLDCDHEGFVSLADKLCEKDLAVRSKRFTKDVLKYLIKTNTGSTVSNAPVPEAISVKSGRNTSSESSEIAFSEDCFPSQEDVNSDMTFMKKYKNQQTQYFVPAGMPFEQKKKKELVTSHRISKMNGIIDRMKQSNYSDTCNYKNRNENNLTVTSPTQELTKAAVKELVQSNKSVGNSKELNDHTIEHKQHKTVDSYNQSGSTSGVTFNKSVKGSCSMKNVNLTSNKMNVPTSEVKKSASQQPNMSKFIEKIAKMKQTTQNIETKVSKNQTKIDKTDSVQPSKILECNINYQSSNSVSSNKENTNDSTDLSIPAGSKNIDYSKQLQYKSNNLILLEKLKSFNSKNLNCGEDDISTTRKGQSTEYTKNTTSPKIKESENKSTEKDVQTQVEILHQPDVSNNNRSVAESKTAVDLKQNKNLKFIDKIKNLNCISLKKTEVTNNQSENYIMELKQESTDNISSEDKQKIQSEKMVIDFQPSESVTPTQVHSSRLLSKLKTLNPPSAIIHTENISGTSCAVHSSVESLLNSGNALEASEIYHTKSETLPSCRLANSSFENPTRLSMPQTQALNLLDKIKHLHLFKSFDNSESSFLEKCQISFDIPKSSISINSVESAEEKLNEETIEKHGVSRSVEHDVSGSPPVFINTLDTSVDNCSLDLNISTEYCIDTDNQLLKLESVQDNKIDVENDQSNEKTVNIHYPVKCVNVEENQQNEEEKKESVELKSSLPVENKTPEVESKRLSLSEKLKLLKQSMSGTAITVSTPNTSLSNNRLDANISAEYSVDADEFFSENFQCTSYQSDSHISFKSGKSFVQNCSVMTLSSTRNSDVSFEDQNSSKVQGYFDFVRSGSVLIHGKRIYKPVTTFYDADFDEVISKNLENCGLRDLSRIQKYAFPVIMDRRNIVMVSSRHTGKSLAYIVPLLCLLRQADYYQKLHVGNGPRAVIIVSGWKKAQKIFNMCNKLLSSTCDVKVQVAFVGGDELNMKIKLTNGCDLLISTPRCFLRLLKEKYVTNINRMCHLVLDETDKLFSTFMPELQELVNLLKKMLTARESSGINIPVQGIVLSYKWTPPLEELTLNVLQDPVICIASLIEAAVYSRVKPIAIFLKPENKIAKLFELLETKPKQRKTVVVCAQQEEVEKITLAAKMKDVEIIPVHEGVSHIHCADLQKIWASKPASHEPILVCTDNVLSELAVVDAQNLIHFSLPPNKTSFSFRFGCLLNAYRNIFDPDDQRTCQVHIFVDENNDIQLPEITWFLERIGIKVPSYLEATVSKILEQREMKKENVFFCENLKQFGLCWDQHKCSSRHILKKEEGLCHDVPQSGRIKMIILHVHNAGHYSVRLLEHFNGTDWTKLPQVYLQIVMEVNNYFINEETRRLHGFPNVGDIAGFEINSNSYQRVKVLKITEYDEKINPSTVLVKLIDQGFIIECQVMSLFMLPEKLKVYPAQAVDVYLCKMLPVDLDQTWNDAIRNKVASWVKELSEQHGNSYFVGKVVLSLGMDIWLDPLECAEWLPLCNDTVEYMSMRKKLLEENLAVDNPEHLTTLYKLCEEAGISYPQEKSEPKNQTVSSEIKPQWAHLPKDDYTCVNLLEISSLDKIFLRIVAFQDRLEILSKDIKAEITNNNTKDSISPGLLNVGDCCLGRFPDDEKWYRAMVMNKSDNKLQLFFVDHGDFADVGCDDVKKIRSEFVTRLPFQIIECCLAGVEPLDGQDWEEGAIDFLFDITEIDEVAKNIYVKVCEIDLKAKMTGGRRYKVILVDTTGSTDVIINQELVLQGFAKYKTEEKHLLENVFMNEDNESELVEEVEKFDNNINVRTNPLSAENYSESMRTSALTKEENDRRIEQFLKDVESDEFEYVGKFMDDYDQDSSVETVKSNTNKISIEEVHDDNRTVNNTEYGCKLNTSETCDSAAKNFEEPSNDFSELVNYGKCPNIIWHQNDQYVWIRIVLTDVQKYRLVWKIREIHFSSVHQDVFYCVNLDLYGGMKAEHVYHTVNGFYVEVKLKKAVKGLLWPRLIQEKKKLPWIKTNLEHYKEVEYTCVDDLIDELKLFKPNQPLNNEDDASSERSEVYEPDVVPYDPYDPFG